LKKWFKMNYFEFQKVFKETPVISVSDVKMYFSNFDRNALTRWQNKGYLEKIRNGYYRLADNKPKNEMALFFMANRIYQPSYISLQSALSHYGFIPEGVFTATSITTKRKREFDTLDKTFSYQQIKRELFFGYKLFDFGRFRFKIASPEKAILDFLYCYPQYNSVEDMAGLRWNIFEIKEKIDFEIFAKYLKIFQSKAMNQRVKCFLKYIEKYDVIN
jgi:predicted transcriptional regulator of viral defense system